MKSFILERLPDEPTDLLYLEVHDRHVRIPQCKLITAYVLN